MKKLTIPEIALQARISNATNFNNATTIHQSILPSTNKKPSKWNTNLIIHYTHENRLINSKKDIHRIWNDLFRRTPVIHTRLIIGTKNIPNLVEQLMRHRPIKTREERHKLKWYSENKCSSSSKQGHWKFLHCHRRCYLQICLSSFTPKIKLP